MKTIITFLSIILLVISNLPIFAQGNFWTKKGVESDSSVNCLFVSSSGNLYAGSGSATSGGAMYLSTNDGTSWSKPYNAGGPGVSAVLVLSSNIILLGTGSGTSGVIKKTTDGGSNWSTVHTFGMLEVPSTFLKTSSGIYVASGLYGGSAGKILFSSDNGDTWTEKTNSLGAILSLAKNSSGDIYAGNQNGDINKSTDGGDSWTIIKTGSNHDAQSIAINSSDYIYVGVEDSGVFKSTDDGSSWTQINSGLGDKPVTAILLVNDTLCFVGTTQNGVYRSTNAGSSWSSVSTGLGWMNVGSGAIKLYNNYLYCGVGNGLYKSSREATDIPAPPGPPKNLSSTDGEKIVTLNWNESDSANTNLIYRIYRNTGGGSFSLRKDNIANGTTQYIDSVNNDVEYSYYMTAYDGNKSLESDTTSHVDGMSTLHDPVPPDAPTNLQAFSGDGFVDLTWTASQATPIHYSIFRSTTSGQYNFSTPLVSSLDTLAYTDNTVTNEVRYYYVVRAVNDTSSLSSRNSNEVSANPVKPNPEAPSNLQIEVNDPDIILTWDPSTSIDITEYRIYRSNQEGTNFSMIGTTSPTTMTYTDNPNRDTTFYYRVTAYDDVHESNFTNEVNGKLETLALTIQVTPQTRYIVDRYDTVSYDIVVRDQTRKLTQADLEIGNSVLNQTLNFSTDENGYYNYKFEIPSDQVFADYSMTFTVTKTDFVMDSALRFIKVMGIPRSTNAWAYVYNEGTIPKIIFALQDTNNQWQGTGITDKITNNDSAVIINDFLKFKGTMTIDTSINHSIEANGKWYVNSPATNPNDFVLLEGNLTSNFNSTTMTFTTDANNFGTVSTIFGVKIHLNFLSFIGGLYSTGIKTNGNFTLNGVKVGCEATKTDTINISGLVFDEDDIKADLAKLSALSPDPIACYNNLSLNYNSGSDSLFLDGDFSIPWLDVQGTSSIANGVLSNIDLYTTGGQAADIDETGMKILGLSGVATGISVPPMGMSLSGMIVSPNPDFFELDAIGSVLFPQKINLNVTQARLLHEPTFGRWQIVGPMTGQLDVTSNLTLNGLVNAGTLDGNNYAVSGQGHLIYTWMPDDMLRGGIQGTVTITDFPNQFPFDLIEMLWPGSFPVRLNNADIFVHNKLFKGNLYFGGLIGTLNFVLDLNKNYGDDGFFEIGTGAINLNAMVKRGGGKGEKVQNINPYQLEGQSIPLMVMKKDGTQTITHNDTLDLLGGMDKVFIRIMSDTQVPGSNLIDPNGNKHSSTDTPPKDTNVVYKQSANGKKGYWIIKDNFDTGQWITEANPNETKPDDYLDVFATFDKRDIQLSVSKPDSVITVNWNNTAVPQEPYVEFYLAKDTNDINGLFIGTAQEDTGNFKFTMTDTLPDCKYYLYVLRYDGDKVDRYYSNVELWNNKGNLSPPTVTSSVYYGSTKKMVVKWTDINNPDEIQGYLIKLTFADGSEQIIARPYAGTDNIEIDIDIDLETNPILKISIAAYTPDGYQSCWSDENGVVLDVKDYTLAGFENDNDKLSIFPNPTTDITNIRFIVTENSNIKITVFDLLGNKIEEPVDNYYTKGIYDVKLKIDKFISGTYYIRYQLGEKTITKLLVINK